MKTLRFFKRTGTDILGVIFIILSPLLGWLPGPGGIPFLLVGLRLLAINHPWADRMQKRILKDGVRFFKALFGKSPLVRAFHDFLSAALIVLGIYLINVYTRNLTLTFAIFCILTGLALFLGNRERLENLVKIMRRKI
jgi:hypothetical protein